MLRFFRFNDPYRLVFVLLAVVILGVKAEWELNKITAAELNGVLVGEMMADGKSLYTEVWHPMPPLTGFVQYLADLLFNRSLMARHVVSLVFIFFQAARFGVLLITNRAFNESNYLPAFIFVLLAFFSFDTIGLTGELIGSTLLLLAMNNLLEEIEFKRQQDETIHNLGFYLGLASLSVFSYIVFFFGVAILLFLFTRVEWRRFGLYMIGFLLPHLFLNLWYYWSDNLDLLWTNFYFPNLNLHSSPWVGLKGLIVLTAVPLVYFLLSLIMMRRDARLTKYQSQIAQVMFLWFLLGLIEFYFGRVHTPQALLVCCPPLAYFVSHYFLLIRRKWIAEVVLWILVVCLITSNSLSVRNQLKWVDLSRLYTEPPTSIISGKKILVLEDDLSPYLNNKTSAYFLDWGLSKPVFKEPDVYQNVLLVADAFVADPPDIIIDREDNFKGVLCYLPQVREKYRREGYFYIRVP